MVVHRSVSARAALAALLLVGLAACKGGDSAKPAPAGGAPSADNPVVATLNGREIRKDELTAWIKEDLYKREVADKAAGEAYEFEVEAIDSLVDEQLLADAAKAAGKPPEVYLDEQVAALGPVSDDEVKAFFDQNRQRLPPDATLDAFKERIRQHLTGQRPDKIREDMRKKAQITVLLQPPRVPVAADGP